jgi:type VI protein secretion system component VasK
VHQAANQNYEKAMNTVRQISRGFKPVGVEGLDSAAQRLLEEPIRMTKGYIIADMDKAAAGKLNGELSKLCGVVRTTTRKYPFHQSGEDASLEELASLFAPGAGVIWKFQAQSLADLTAKEGSTWKAKDPAKKPAITDEMLAFLNRSQVIADAFYPAGATQPQLTYTLRPRLDGSWKDGTLELQIDGRLYNWTSSLQKQFTWPSPAGSKDLGAVGRVRLNNGASVPFASRGGLWGIFRIMGDAEPRPPSSKIVEWKKLRGGTGRSEDIEPVRLEIVEFPGGVDLFNPKFFEGLQCPSKGVQ